jgi:hypothetical protein
LNVTVERALRIVNGEGFPAPVTSGTRRTWNRDDVERWMGECQRMAKAMRLLGIGTVVVGVALTIYSYSASIAGDVVGVVAMILGTFLAIRGSLSK